MTNKMKWFIAILLLIVSFGVGAASCEDCEPKDCPEQEVKTVTKEVCTQEDTWRELKRVDDEGFGLASESFSYISEAFYALSDLNFDEADMYMEKVRDNSLEMEKVAEERQKLLTELGY